MANWVCAAARDLPIVRQDSWDGAAAERSVWAWATNADGEIDAQRARRAFLAYDSSAPELKGSYKLPFAFVRGGELVASAAGLRAAASRLPQTDIPEDVRQQARRVLDGYFRRLNESVAMTVQLRSATERGELMAFRCVVARAERNRNNAEITPEGIRELAATLPKMPLTYADHSDPRAICGYFTDARAVADATVLEADAVLFARRFPELADGIRRGTLKLSVECWVGQSECLTCGAVWPSEDGADPCEHLTASPTPPRRVRGLTAFGACLTTTPAGTNTIIYPDSLAMVAKHLALVAASIVPADASAEMIDRLAEMPVPLESFLPSQTTFTFREDTMDLVCSRCGATEKREDLVPAAELAVLKRDYASAQAAIDAAEARAANAERELAEFKASIERERLAEQRCREVAALIGEEKAAQRAALLASFTDEQYQVYLEDLRAAAPVRQPEERLVGSLGILVQSDQQSAPKPPRDLRSLFA